MAFIYFPQELGWWSNLTIFSEGRYITNQRWFQRLERIFWVGGIPDVQRKCMFFPIQKQNSERTEAKTTWPPGPGHVEGARDRHRQPSGNQQQVERHRRGLRLHLHQHLETKTWFLAFEAKFLEVSLLLKWSTRNPEMMRVLWDDIGRTFSQQSQGLVWI